MVLTKENIETSEGVWDVGAVWRDIARMDQDQLGNYIRSSFTLNPDYYPDNHHQL